ncbi:hypothetical protein K490DRAFT_14541, partial [Saccharata proteae CBS 121410]
PLVNKKATVLALTITFQLVAWLAVLLRLFARFRLSRSAGWDDFFVVFACVRILSNILSLVVICSRVTDYGLGKHLLTLGKSDWTAYLYFFWSATASYVMSTTLIKISILVQYLRLFKSHLTLFRVCIGLLVVVTVWGTVFFFCLIFSCVPVDKFWNLSEPGHCFGFGVGTTDSTQFYHTFTAHSASNMVLDIIVLTLPAFALSSINLEGKRKFAIVGLMTLGAIVVTISIIRMASIVATQAGQYPTKDPTWLSPPAIILSCIETDIAILCASIPIFWPVLSVLSLGSIFVTNEVIVRAE